MFDTDGRLAEQSVEFVQQALSHDSGVLSVEELSYRNPEVESGAVDDHRRKLASAELTERLSADHTNDLQNTYWTVTERGVARLDELGFYDEIGALAVGVSERTERVDRIETFDGRPRVDVSE